MAKKTARISTSEFSSLSGLTVSQVSKLLREGKIKGVKESGKWMISKNQLALRVVKDTLKSQKPAMSKKKSAKTRKYPLTDKKTPSEATQEKDPTPKSAIPPSASAVVKKIGQKKTYSVAEFSARTYLTEFGVMDWLKKGRLRGTQDENGQWRVDDANLELPGIKHLLRD
ncbi:MAG: hypothetical protein JSU83_02390 [Deltaproteobacteria bacterium]|nr:MAG: hypothetical protein JSU83_02390 [Deltaproteobacteria bacterium]